MIDFALRSLLNLSLLSSAIQFILPLVVPYHVVPLGLRQRLSSFQQRFLAPVPRLHNLANLFLFRPYLAQK